MIDLQAYLEKKVCDIISTWDEEDIYVISFFVYSMRRMNTMDIQILQSFL